MTGERVPPKRARARRAATLLFGCAVLGGITFGVADAFTGSGTRALARMVSPGGVPLLLLGVAAYGLGLYFSMRSWRVLVTEDGDEIPPHQASRMFFLGMAGKYVPGRVWGVFAHLRLGKDQGIGAGRVVTAYAMSLVVTTVTGAAAGLFVAANYLGSKAWLLTPFVVVMAVCLLRPGWLNRLMVPIRRRFSAAGPTEVRNSSRQLRRSLLAAFLSWLLMGVHLWLLSVLLGAAVLPALPVALSAFALASVAGTLTLVLPDGWGARELVLTLPLAAVLPWGTASVAVVVSRLLCVLCEVAVIGAAVALARLNGRRRGVRSALAVRSEAGA
ncbi:lysylphosphatidylglycerol synthase domain-containing protein [Streptomyces sp. 8L]|uniref:lysylphosphatidylglycerol synthase domain-containing protein n=1 Tax=Streptomyces sp. 8L TaxID=2877242 RepID=UPI001CD1C5F0|nr:lysylphosphatidylglycerol synthase domain-containing protein [Streptomyces sp. 8L]MCA1223127.1 lysylphosphatidylglycerol synthase domain-containing protein [Streptomyces sp. 8L]